VCACVFERARERQAESEGKSENKRRKVTARKWERLIDKERDDEIERWEKQEIDGNTAKARITSRASSEESHKEQEMEAARARERDRGSGVRDISPRRKRWQGLHVMYA